MIWGNRSSAGRGRAVFCGPGLADRPEGAKEAWRLLLPAPSGRERGERAGARCRSRGILCQIKRIPLDNPEEKFWEGFRFPSQTLLETTKGRAAALPLETIPGDGQGSGVYGGRWDGGRESGAGCLRRFRAFCLVGDEVGEGLVVLAPTLGGWGPAGDGGAARRVVVPYGWLRKVSSTILGRGLAAKAAWRPGGWWGPPVGEGSRMGAFVPRPPSSGSSKKGPGPLPGFRRSRRKESGSFFPATCAAGKILLTERSVGAPPFSGTPAPERSAQTIVRPAKGRAHRVGGI